MTHTSRSLSICCGTAAALLTCWACGSTAVQSASVPVPQFQVDPYWPKPLPQEIDAQGQVRRWITGHVGGVCVDSHDHIFTTNRGKPLGRYEKTSGMLAPQVVVYDMSGEVINSWAPFPKEGETNPLPEWAHGCSVDYEDNVWLTGTSDGMAQKWSHDGKKLLLQIGEKGKCDGAPNQSPKARHPSCGEVADYNSSKTLLNSPANLWVDPGPDPVTKERGSIYIADGYGNHRVVVFDSKGKFLRQWGSAGNGPGQFSKTGGGHPHCVALSKDGFLYACDRESSQIFEFDRTGVLKRTIPIDTDNGLKAVERTADIAFSTDSGQTYMYSTDLGNNIIRILERSTGKFVGRIGYGPGQMAGSLLTPHQLAVDSKGNVYVSETLDSFRVQRFMKQ